MIINNLNEIYEIPREAMHNIIDVREPRGLFYIKDETCGKYVACDNRDGDAWVEEFDSLEECIAYLNN